MALCGFIDFKLGKIDFKLGKIDFIKKNIKNTEAYTCHSMFFNFLFVDFNFGKSTLINLGKIDFKLGKSSLKSIFRVKSRFFQDLSRFFQD